MTQRTAVGYQSEPPKTVRELAIMLAMHNENTQLQLIAINESIVHLNSSLQDVASTKADKEDVDQLTKRVELIENNQKAISNKIVNAAVTILVVMILAQYGLAKFFK